MSKLLHALNNIAFTENGALSNKSTESHLLDFYAHAPARRGKSIVDLFANAYKEDKTNTLKAMFYLRDVRGGQGERELFRQCLRWLNDNDRETFDLIFPLAAEYGRWDDLLQFVDNPKVVFLVHSILVQAIDGESTLLAKWMPSTNTSCKATRNLAYRWVNALQNSTLRYYAEVLRDRRVKRKFAPINLYRRMLVELRTKLALVETSMSKRQWSTIKYEHVPSRASYIYRNAFKKRDEVRYNAFIQKAVKGEVKINAGTLYPYEIVEKVFSNQYDATLEALWRQLPDYAENMEETLVVCDVSGSMMSGTGSIRPLDVAVSLAIYIGERMQGAFRNHFMTFSRTPQLVQIKGDTLKEKVNNINSADWGGNTKIQAVFDLVLQTALGKKLTQADLPKYIMIISDMQFDTACPDNNATNFEKMRQKFDAVGYDLPTIIFWNVNSRYDETPVCKDDQGTFLVAGCSPSILRLALNKDTTPPPTITPYQSMMQVLSAERYSIVDFVLYS